METFLDLIDVNYTYHTPEGETPALTDISFTVENGEFIAIVGPSGSGKSTLLNLICGLIRPSSGQILLHGNEITGPRPEIGYMLQKDHLFEWRTVFSNILLGLEIQNRLTNDAIQKAENLLDIYGLSGFKNARPSELSGGMRQRAALIRTLVLEPELLLLDEPFSALDYQTRLSVCDDIGSIIRKEQKTAVLVTHDLSEAISMADRVIVLTSRPGTVKADIPVLLDIPDRTPFKSRNAPNFREYFNRIWKELNVHA